jgi:hypothetical protein
MLRNPFRNRHDKGNLSRDSLAKSALPLPKDKHQELPPQPSTAAQILLSHPLQLTLFLSEGRTFNSQGSFFDGPENGQIQMCLSSFFGTHSPDHLRPILNRLLGMKRALFAREALVNDLRFFIDA